MGDANTIIDMNNMNLRKINIATLNFSGINTNPFEYDDGSAMFKQINSHVKELIDKELPTMNEWLCGKVDKLYQHNRLSVGFTSKMAAKEGKLLNREDFEDTWMKMYLENPIK